MSQVFPFCAARPPRHLVAQVAAPPYDVVNTAEARDYAANNAVSFFHVSRPEIDLPAHVSGHDDQVYRRARENVARFLKEGTLIQDAQPRFYAYQQRMGAHVQVGLVACASVEEYNSGLIKKHELTRQDKEDDRTRHVDELGGNDEPVFLTYKASASMDALMGQVTAAAPEYDFITSDGIAHTFWLVPAPLTASIQHAMAQVPALYIADGHHRSAAASRVAALRQGRRQAGGHAGFMCVIFPHNQMQVLDYNRVVKDLNGHPPQALCAALEKHFVVEPSPQKKPVRALQFGMYLQRRWYLLSARPGSYPSTLLGQLDVNVLQNNVLAPLLGIRDPRTDQRIHFTGGIRGMQELERLVDSGAHAVAFSMFPTTVDQLMALADAGEIMPPKSTWFEPKLRSGLFVHLF